MCGLSLLALLGCKKPPATEEAKAPPLAVRCAPPAKATVTDVLHLRGHIEAPPGGDLQLAAQVAGKISSVEVTEGRRIARGDVIAILDDAAFRDAARAADAAVVQAKAARANADVSLARTRQLVERGIAPKQELDDAVARADAAKGAVDAAIAADDSARRTLERIKVRATFDGSVTKILRGAGALVDGTAATPIAQIAVETREFVADATERELSLLAVDQATEVTLVGTRAGDPAITGTIRLRAHAIDPVTGFGYVRASLRDASKSLVGQYGKATVTLGRRENVLVVPAAAVRGASADGTELVLCKDGQAEVKSVKTGYRDAERVEIVEGLAAEESVALDHVLGLETGTAITVSK